MYRISYEKCVCFIFLVILAILSCSGFRIDNLAMTDISKRNFHTSSSFSNSDEFFDRIFNVRSSPSVETITPAYRHKIRHHRQLRAQAHSLHNRRYDTQKPPTGHIDVQVFPPRGSGSSPTTHPSEHFAQIPSTDIHHPLFPTTPVVTRSQRSSDQKRHQKQESKWQPSQEEDVSMKAFKAEIVVLAQAQSCSTCLCVFKVNTTFKNTKQFPVIDRIPLKMPCEREEKPKSKNLVKNRIQLGKSYILFLNASSAHNYLPVGVPKLIRPIKRAKIEKVVKQVCKTKFVPTTPKIVELRDVSRTGKKTEKRKLLCKVRGFPIPAISWRRKGEILHQNQHLRIQYRSDGTDGKQSRLIIKKMDAENYGQYECIAEGVNGQVASKAITVSDPSLTLSETFSSGKECDAPLRTEYCRNGGTCHKELTMGEYYCICAPGYSGSQCDTKVPSHSRLAVMFSSTYSENMKQKKTKFHATS